MNLKHHFLLAMPTMEDSIFSRGIVYLCEHDESGAIGLMINKPSPVHMEVVFAAIGKKTPEKLQGQFVMLGGPVQPERGFVLHTPLGHWESSLHITNELALTTSRDIIDGLAQNQSVDSALLTIGCSRWSAGQLERELAQNAWLVVPADNDILFHTPAEQRYDAALSKLGIRAEQIMGAGYA